MIDAFLKKYEELISNKKYEEFVNFCSQELSKFSNIQREFSEEECNYIATIYMNLAPFLDDESALNCMNSAIYYVPNSPSLYFSRAEIKKKLSDFNGALEDYSIVIENAPSSDAYGLRGDLKAYMGDIEGAIKDFQNILNLEPGNQNAKNAINGLVVKYAQDNNIPCLECTLKTGEKVYSISTNFGVFNIPAE